MAFRGFTRQLQRHGAWFQRVALGTTDDPVYPPLHIKPTDAPSGDAEAGDIYVDANGALQVHNGTAFVPSNAGATEVVTAANTITADESGKTFFLTGAAGYASTLPAPALGLTFKFIIAEAFATTSHTIVTNGGANVIQGSVEVNGAVVAGVNEDTITFVNSAESLGDWVELVADATNWYVRGSGALSGAITLTAS